MTINDEAMIVLGGTGNLGNELLQMFQDSPNFTGFISGFGSKTFNLTSPDAAIKTSLDSMCPPIIINTAAYTNVDGAESEPELADQINHQGVKSLAEWARDNGKWLIHLSTDYVFDGKKGSPYTVNDATCPINTYGKTKALGEEAIMSIYPERSTILRTSWLYGRAQRGFLWFVANAALAMRNHQLHPKQFPEAPTPIKVANDQIGTPTCTYDLCGLIMSLLQNPQYGILHGCSHGQTTRYDQALALCTAANIAPDFMSAQSTAEFNFPAQRPLNTAMESSFESMPEWRVALQAFAAHHEFQNPQRIEPELKLVVG